MFANLQKTIGLDDDYIKKVEQQKRLREEILRKKAASRKKLSGNEDGEKMDTSQSAESEKSPSKPSVNVNPKTFKGDMSGLKNGESNSVKTAGVKTRKVVLRIVKDKHGNTISRKKVKWLYDFIHFLCSNYLLQYKSRILISKLIVHL